jgi:Holliday junction resolvase
MKPSQNTETGEKSEVGEYKKVFRPSITTKHEENIKKSKEAEELFLKFLNDQKIPFVYVDQSLGKSSKEMLKNNIRRPDYIIHTKKETYYIDVKNRKKMIFGVNFEKRFYLNQNEIITLFNFQKKLKEYVWISFINDLKNPQFFYASILELYEYYKNVLKSIGESFFDLLKEHSIERYNELDDELWIFIPDKMLYNQLSLERGFYGEPDNVFEQDNIFFEKEAKYHKLKWRNKIEEHFSSSSNTVYWLDLLY